jgi:hypothetical protein
MQWFHGATRKLEERKHCEHCNRWCERRQPAKKTAWPERLREELCQSHIFVFRWREPHDMMANSIVLRQKADVQRGDYA